MSFKLSSLIESDLCAQGWSGWVTTINARLETQLSTTRHGDFERWLQAVLSAPDILHSSVDVAQNAVTVHGECLDVQRLDENLRQLIPWRKGPFQIADIFVDTEWRSDFKWDRIAPHIDLNNKRVLDVGCGNGYHCWRMLQFQPRWVLGIDPNVLFNMQFRMLNKYASRTDIDVVPLGIEHMPSKMGFFDTVFSMGVLYHRKSPIEHLYDLKHLLTQQGKLILETLVIDGGEQDVLVPQQRYAKMNNVWFIPSVAALSIWLKKVGFKRLEVLDVAKTAITEQRVTDWMRFESLENFLDPENSTLTIEGHPAPKRAVFKASLV